MVMSAISTNSGPGSASPVWWEVVVELSGLGVWKCGLGGSGGREMLPVNTLDAAAASRFSPDLPPVDRVDMGRDGRVATAVVAAIVVGV